MPNNTVNQIVAGLYLARAPVTSGINLHGSNAPHPLRNCRLYYSQIVVNPQKSLDYVQRNRNKKVVCRTVVTNTYKNNFGVGSSFNALINSGIVHPTGVRLVPFITSVQNSGFGDNQ